MLGASVAFGGRTGEYSQLGEQEYPRFILGGDKFLDYWGLQSKADLATVGGVLAVMQRAYALGVRGFDVSLSDHVINAAAQLRLKHPDVVVIGNPNWQCGIKLGDVGIETLRDRFRKTLLVKLSPKQREEVKQIPPMQHQRWFGAADDATALTDNDVSAIYLDKERYFSNLSKLRGVADYILVGADYADWLIPLGRTDILAQMADIVRRQGLRPLSLSHFASITLPALDDMGFEGHWIYLNQGEQLLSSAGVLRVLQETIRPVTAFRTLGGGALTGDVAGAFRYLRNSGVTSVVVGAESPNQLDSTIPTLINVFEEQ